MGSGHGGAAVSGIATVEHCAEDVHTRCGDIHRSDTEIRETGEVVAVVSGGDSDNVVVVVVGRVVGEEIVVSK